MSYLNELNSFGNLMPTAITAVGFPIGSMEYVSNALGRRAATVETLVEYWRNPRSLYSLSPLYTLTRRLHRGWDASGASEVRLPRSGAADVVHRCNSL